MVKFINSWAQGIILSVIIGAIIEIILPEGNNKKFVKTIIGIYVLFSIIYPVINEISNKNINLDLIINNTADEMEKYSTNVVTIETNSYIENTYINKLKENIKQTIKEKGYDVEEINLYIESKNEERYGQINNIVMKVTKTEENVNNNEVNKVKKIDVSISDKIQKNEENKKISEVEINSLKQYLYNTYSVEMEKIHINE